MNEYSCVLNSEISNNNFYYNNNKKIYVDHFCPKEYPYEITATKECVNYLDYNKLLNGDIKPNYYALNDTYNLISEKIKKNDINIIHSNDLLIFGYNITFEYSTINKQNSHNYSSVNII